MAMMRVMQATRMEREGRWPSEGSMCTGVGVGGAGTFLGLYAEAWNGWIADSRKQKAKRAYRRDAEDAEKNQPKLMKRAGKRYEKA